MTFFPFAAYRYECLITPNYERDLLIFWHSVRQSVLAVMTDLAARDEILSCMQNFFAFDFIK
jgi:hypothetical protein